MLQKVHIQILDNPMENVILDAEEFEEPIKNKILAEELRKEMNYSYPTVVSVEYIDLFMEDDTDFPDIKEMLRQGAINTPVILINGVPRIHGGIPRAVIREEVERLLSSGPLH
jgi:glutaredoxin